MFIVAYPSAANLLYDVVPLKYSLEFSGPKGQTTGPWSRSLIILFT